MKQIIRLTESDIHRIVKQVITETVEEDMHRVGMHQGAADNVRNRHRLGQRFIKRPNGTLQNNKKRYNDAKVKIKQETMEEFINTFGEKGVDLVCSCWYFESFAYEFTVHVRGIEQINTHNFSIYGDIIDVDDTNLVDTLKSAIVPKTLNNVVLVYNFANRSLRFTTKKSGLVIKPEDEGTMGWSKLLDIVGRFYYLKIAR